MFGDRFEFSDGAPTADGILRQATEGPPPDAPPMPFSDCSRAFHVLVSAVTGSDRVLAPGVDVVLEVVWMAMNKLFPTLMPALYPGYMATDPKPYASLDAMWKTCSDLAHNRTPAVNGENIYCLLYTSPSPRDRQKSRMPSSA